MAKKLNYNLYLGENPNPKDTNNIIVQGTVENGKLTSIESAKLGDKDLVGSIIISETTYDGTIQKSASIALGECKTVGEAFISGGEAFVDWINSILSSEPFFVYFAKSPDMIYLYSTEGAYDTAIYIDEETQQIESFYLLPTEDHESELNEVKFTTPITLGDTVSLDTPTVYY